MKENTQRERLVDAYLDKEASRRAAKATPSYSRWEGCHAPSAPFGAGRNSFEMIWVPNVDLTEAMNKMHMKMLHDKEFYAIQIFQQRLYPSSDLTGHRSVVERMFRH